MAYKISNTKEIREYIKEVEKQGWTVIKTNGDHLKWISPNGGFVISASTSSDRKRFFYNLNKDMAKFGYIPNRKVQKKKEETK